MTAINGSEWFEYMHQLVNKLGITFYTHDSLLTTHDFKYTSKRL